MLLWEVGIAAGTSVLSASTLLFLVTSAAAVPLLCNIVFQAQPREVLSRLPWIISSIIQCSLLMRKLGPDITDVCVSEAAWAILPGFITTRSYWSSQEGNSCNVPFLLCSTAIAWFTASYLFHCNSSRVANGFCDFCLVPLTVAFVSFFAFAEGN